LPGRKKVLPFKANLMKNLTNSFSNFPHRELSYVSSNAHS
jgi:hypothetical protein